MNAKIRGVSLVIGAGLAFSAGATPVSAVFDFTGQVTSASSLFNVPIGALVTGTFTINESAGTSGTLPSQVAPGATWGLADNQGVAVGTSPGQNILTTTVNYGATEVYQSLSPVSGTTESSSIGNPGGNFQASETVQLNLLLSYPLEISQSSFQLSGPGPTYDSQGLPIAFAAGQGGGTAQLSNSYYTPTGILVEQDSMAFNLVSLQPVSSVPLPASSGLMAAGLLALGAFARSRRRA